MLCTVPPLPQLCLHSELQQFRGYFNIDVVVSGGRGEVILYRKLRIVSPPPEEQNSDCVMMAARLQDIFVLTLTAGWRQW